MARPAEAVAGVKALGIPAPAFVARSLPALELAVALVLLTAPRVGAVLALVTLCAFSAVLFKRIEAGVKVPCACFGAGRHESVSSVDLARNGLLAILAVAALFASRPRWPSLAGAIVVSCAVLTGKLVLGLLQLRRQAGAVWSNAEAREAVRP